MRKTLLLLLVANAMSFAAQAATLSVFAGGGSKESGPATECKLADPFAVDFDAAGNAYISEMTNNRLVMVDVSGQLRTFAGTTKKGYTGDGGPAKEATLDGPHHLLVMKNGDVLVVGGGDVNNQVLASTELHLAKKH